MLDKITLVNNIHPEWQYTTSAAPNMVDSSQNQNITKPDKLDKAFRYWA